MRRLVDLLRAAKIGAGIAVLGVGIAVFPASAGSSAGLPDFGNPNGHFPVPAAGRAVTRAIPTT